MLCIATAQPVSATDSVKVSERNKPNSNSSEEFFQNANVPHLIIETTDEELQELKKDNRKYVRATVREGDGVYHDVGVHLKGAAGSFRELGDRPSLTLNFDKFKDGQTFHGLDKIHLNNSVQDPSYLTDILCGELFLAAGVPAARGTHARVELNGRDLGLYVLKEGFDKKFLRRHFKNPNGNLYESGFMNEITEPLQKNSGDHDVQDYTDLAALANAAQKTDPIKRMERLKQILDLERFISFIALEVMICHWDGYAIRRNNYRVYHDPNADKIVFFPHGMDQMFLDPTMRILPTFQGLVGQAVVTSPEGRQRYRQRMISLLTNVFKVQTLTNRIHELQGRIRPALESINPDLVRTHDIAVDSLCQRIVQRAENLEKQLHSTGQVSLRFDAAGVARISDWHPQNGTGAAVMQQVGFEGHQRTLYIRADSQAPWTAAWRAKVVLEAGLYRFEGQLRTAGLVALKSEQGEGAALYATGSPRSPTNLVSSDSPWTTVAHDFTVEPGFGEIELICELRAAKGEVWFDEGSLRLVRKRN